MGAPGANGIVSNGHTNGARFDTSRPRHHSFRGKEDLIANADQEQGLPQQKRDTVNHDGPFHPTELHVVQSPASSILAATNGPDDDTALDLYDFEELEFDNADFELNLLAARNLVEEANSPESPGLVEDIWPYVSLTPSPDNQEPPRSVLLEFDNASVATMTPTFDPTLQFSPPNSASLAVDESSSGGKGADDEVSWDYINSELQYTCTDNVSNCSKDAITAGSASHSYGFPLATPPSTAASLPPAGMLLRPYKAWFHLREMLQAKESMYRNQPAVRFEFFARVLYTRRENFEKKQLFQLRDLFKLSPPYIAGVLRD